MHACGHDGHTASLMCAAEVLAKYRKELRGNVKIIFEPAEEDIGKARLMKKTIGGSGHDSPEHIAFDSRLKDQSVSIYLLFTLSFSPE